MSGLRRHSSAAIELNLTRLLTLAPEARWIAG